MVDQSTTRLILDMNVREYFQKKVSLAIVNQHVDATADTQYYVVNMLTLFTDSERLFDRTADGPRFRPLGSLYAEALELEEGRERCLAMKRLGDVSLFIAGLFSDSLKNKVVDVDYYIAMGGSAYGYLGSTLKGRETGYLYSEIFAELAHKFTDFVDILAEVGEQSRLKSEMDVLRIHEFWLKTRSRRAESQLKGFGIFPANFGSPQRTH